MILRQHYKPDNRFPDFWPKMGVYAGTALTPDQHHEFYRLMSALSNGSVYIHRHLGEDRHWVFAYDTAFWPYRLYLYKIVDGGLQLELPPVTEASGTGGNPVTAQ